MKYYSSFQAADELAVSTKTLERWRQSGQFKPAMRTAGGHARYSQDQIDNAKMGIYDEVNVKELMS